MSRELDDLIRNHEGPLLVCLRESAYPQWAHVEAALNLLEEKGRGKISVVRLDYEEYREWASQFGIYGFPSTLVFSKGRLSFKLRGSFDYPGLMRVLERENL